MKYNIEFKGFEPQQGIRRLIERLITKVERKAKRFSPDAVFSRVLVEQNPARRLAHVSIAMELPGKTLATQAKGHEVEVSLKDAFAELERQLATYKASLRRVHGI